MQPPCTAGHRTGIAGFQPAAALHRGLLRSACKGKQTGDGQVRRRLLLLENKLWTNSPQDICCLWGGEEIGSESAGPANAGPAGAFKSERRR